MKDLIFERMTNFGQNLLQKAKRIFGQAEVLVRGGTGIDIWFENGELTNIEEHQTANLGLRIIYRGHLGITGTLEPKGKDQLIEEAKISSQYGDKAYFTFPPGQSVKKVKTCSESVVKTSVEKIVAEGKKAIKHLHLKLPEFNPSLLLASWGWGKVNIFNSNGAILANEGTGTEISLEISRKKEGDFWDVTTYWSSRRWEKNFVDLTAEIEKSVSLGKKIIKLPKDPFLVVFPPKTVGVLLDYLSVAINGRKVNDRASRLVGKLGQPLFDKRINLISSALEDFRPASSPFDDEGVPTSKLSIIKGGILKNFIYDLQEAGKAGVKPTGSGSRGSIFTGAYPSTDNLILSGGAESWPSILKTIKKGILVDSFVGQGQGNVLNGDFSLRLHLGYLIDKGQIVGRVKGAGIAGNVFDILKDSLTDLSHETEWWGGIKAPYLVLAGITISAKR